MPSISSSPQEEVGQSHLSRHTGLGSEVRGEPSAADARRAAFPFAGIRASVTSPPSVVGTDVGTSASDNSPNFGLSRSTRRIFEARFEATTKVEIWRVSPAQ